MTHPDSAQRTALGIALLVTATLCFALLDRVLADRDKQKAEPSGASEEKPAPRVELPVSQLTDHVVLVGHGRVGSVVSRALRQAEIPFLVIDIVVSAALMSMGMMMLPPATVSLPFKLLLFVLVDGWAQIITALVGSYR